MNIKNIKELEESAQQAVEILKPAMLEALKELGDDVHKLSIFSDNPYGELNEDERS